MRTRVLGRTDLRVSVLGLGTANRRGQKAGQLVKEPLDLDTEKGTIWASLEGGCRLIDTAPSYDSGGYERIIRQAFSERPDLSADVLVTTKVGHSPAGYDGTYDMAMRCVEGSMERLGVDRFPLLYIHDPMGFPMELIMSERGTLGALRALQKRGLLDYVGIAANDPEVNAAYLETGEFDAALVPESWSLSNHLAEAPGFRPLSVMAPGWSSLHPWRSGCWLLGHARARDFLLGVFRRRCLSMCAIWRTSATSMAFHSRQPRSSTQYSLRW